VSLDNVQVDIARAKQLAKNKEARKKEKERLKGLSEIGSILGLQTEDISRSGEGFKQVNGQVATATRLELKFITLAPLECPYHILCIQSTCKYL
jgi:hypothetical protein